MEPSGASRRSSGSTKFSESISICGLRFRGATVDVGITVEVGGRVAVWAARGDDMAGAIVGVERTASAVGATVPQAEVISNDTKAVITKTHFITTIIYKLFKISARFSSYSISLIKLAARSSFSSFILATTCSEL